MREVGPEVGELAPDFTLQSTVGEINLRRFGGGKKLVLAFYVEDLTPG
jgi:peroxiredoxin